MAEFLLRLPKNLFKAAQVQRLDRVAIDHFNCPSFKLMQIAGDYAFQVMLERWPQTRFVRVFAGAGNNAGDGFIIAGLAKKQGLDVEVVLVGDPNKLSPDAKMAYEFAQSTSVHLISFESFQANDSSDHNQQINIDALLGTGLDRIVEGTFESAITLLNQSKAPTLAVDIPSGLNADTGMPMGCAVVADITTTFIGLKQGLLTGRGRDFCGGILFSSLDIPRDVYDHAAAPECLVKRIDIFDATAHFTKRKASAHKGTNGHVVVIGGDFNCGGAPILAASAALRSGAGLVSVVTRSTHRNAALARCPELMVLGTEDGVTEQGEKKPAINISAIEALLKRCTAIVIGPGLGRGHWSEQLFNLALSHARSHQIPLLLDADALYFLEQRQETMGPDLSKNCVITPHPGEAAMLLGCTNAEVQADRFAVINNLHTRFQATCLLKGSGSLVIDSEDAATTYLCSEGNPGMATAGMGDLLSGIVAAFIAQGLSNGDALKAAVCIHGEAADIAAAQGGERGLVATDLLNPIRQLVNPIAPSFTQVI